MTEWVHIKDGSPAPNQPIEATIKYMGKQSTVQGIRSPHEHQVVFFDFYSGTGAEVIIQWRPRELPMLPDAHPWTGIANKGTWNEN